MQFKFTKFFIKSTFIVSITLLLSYAAAADYAPSSKSFSALKPARELKVKYNSFKTDERPSNNGIILQVNDRTLEDRVVEEFSHRLSSKINSGGTGSASVVASSSLPHPPKAFDVMAALKLSVLFVLWYAFNAGYNVYNAYVKRDFSLPWSTAALQLVIGLFYAAPLWFLKIRKVPNINLQDLYKLLPIAILNAGGHSCAVNAMFEKGGGSFTHVIKASEPVVSVILGFLVNKVVPRPFTAASLLPITYGVAYASTLGNLSPSSMSKELTTRAAKMAMGSNVAFAMRSILRKNLPSDFMRRTNLDPANEHAVATLLSFFLTVPIALAFEGVDGCRIAYSAVANKTAFLINFFLCGMTYYLYNEMQNVVLGSLGPVPTAVGNTLKRVVIFVALYLFTSGETFPWPKVLGSAIAILGCLAFAICDSQKI